MSRPIRVVFNKGDVFGKWAVLEYARGSHTKVKCKCSCGTTKYISGHSLRRSENLGCLKCKKSNSPICPDLFGNPNYLRLIKKINSIFRRCYNPKSDHFQHYGGRGIGVYAPWHTDKASMIRYLFSLSGHDNSLLQIDRINNDKDYCPGNLRFVTRSVNIRNRRKLTTQKDADVTIS